MSAGTEALGRALAMAGLGRREEARRMLLRIGDSRFQEAVDRALARHLEKCPTAASLKGAVEVTWTADIGEA